MRDSFLAFLLCTCATNPPTAPSEAPPKEVQVLTAQGRRDAIVFSAAGDHGSGDQAIATLKSLARHGVDFHIALGDMSYTEIGTENRFCELVSAHAGRDFPFQLVAGNHEDDSHYHGFIGNFAQCLPDRMSSTGKYGAQYYFDLDKLLRVILISPALSLFGQTYPYHKGSEPYEWLEAAIDDARRRRIAWIIVGMHKVCISAGEKPCEIGQELMQLLISRNVDLVLQAHEHNYQRSKQLRCARAEVFESKCVADESSDGRFQKDRGTVFAIVGTFGAERLYPTRHDDPERGYFAVLDATSYGFLKIRITAERLEAQFAPSTGKLTDSFAIIR